ncbi:MULTISPECIES: Ig-like domain-containing protein [Corallococcus]|nr:MULTISPECIES: Ig-like domain-containing protein [Corallococcus]
MIAPLHGALLNTATPTMSGRADAGILVTLFINDDPGVTNIGVDAGAWSYLPSVSLREGLNWIRVRSKNAAGNESPFSNTHVFTVDTTAPSLPTISAPDAGAFVRSSALFFQGTADPDTTVSLLFDGADAGTAFASRTGNVWLFADPLPLNEGPHILRARAIDAAGNRSDSAPRSFTVDNTPPVTSLTVTPNTPVTKVRTRLFTFTSEAGADFECRVDSGNFTPCASAQSLDFGEGLHSFEVRAKDKAGNVDPTPESHNWETDLTLPGAPLLTSPDAGAYVATTTPVISGTAEAKSKVTVVVGGQSKGPVDADAAGRWELPVTLVEGTYSLKATAMDTAGNVSPDSVSRSFTVDITAPDTLLDPGSIPEAYSSNTTFPFSFSFIGKPGETGTFECSLDTAGFAPCVSPLTVNVGIKPVGEGPHVFRVRAKDPAENVDGSPAIVNWTVDREAPDTILTSFPDRKTNVRTFTFTFTSTEKEADFQCILDGAGPVGLPFTANCNGGSYAVNVGDGPHTLWVRAQDKAKNIDSSAASFSWEVDATSPAKPAVTSPPQGTFVNTTLPLLKGTAEPGAQVRVFADGVQVGSTTANPQGTWSISPSVELSEGEQEITADATDSYSNRSAPSDPHRFTVDSIAPETKLTKTPPSLDKSGQATFEFNSPAVGNPGTLDPNATFECLVDDRPLVPDCVSPYTVTVGNGSHIFTVRAKDAAGNRDQTPETYSWVVDGTPPDVTIKSKPAAKTNEQVAKFIFESTAPKATFPCQLDTLPAIEDCTANYTSGVLAPGPHMLVVRARNLAGSESPPARWDWVIDTNLPDTIISKAPPELTNVQIFSFEFTSNRPPEEVVTFYCSLDRASEIQDCKSPLVVQVISDGEHTLKITAEDAVGNKDAEPAVHIWTVDTQRPDTLLLEEPKYPGKLVNTSRWPFGFTSTEARGRFECRLDLALPLGCVSPFETDYADGSHTLEIRAIDAAGNEDASPVSYSWVVDTQAPSAPALTTPSAEALVATATPVLEGSSEPGSTVYVSVDGVPVGTVVANDVGRWSYAPTQPLRDGAHAIELRAKDAAGNSSESSTATSLSVDTLVPDTTITAGPQDRVRTTSATFQFSSTEEGATFECSLNNVEFTPCDAQISFEVFEGANSFQVRARDRAGNVDPSPETRAWRVSLGSDTRTLGGGLSCSSSGGGVPFGMLAGLVGLALMKGRRRRV